MNKSVTSTSINLGRAATIPWGQGRCFIVGGQEIAVFRQRDGLLFATQNRCPHREGPLADGLVGNCKVICPLHSHEFDLKTGAGSSPKEKIQTYSVEDIGGNLMLSVQIGVL